MRVRQERIPTLVTVLSLTLLALSSTSLAEVVEADIPSSDPVEDGKYPFTCHRSGLTSSVSRVL